MKEKVIQKCKKFWLDNDKESFKLSDYINKNLSLDEFWALDRGGSIKKAEELISLWELDKMVENEPEILKKDKMKLVKTKTISINGNERQVTIVILANSREVNAGYSIKIPSDKDNPELAEKIARGRALNSKTDLFADKPNSSLGGEFVQKYILHAITDNLFNQMEWGNIVIKGVN